MQKFIILSICLFLFTFTTFAQVATVYEHYNYGGKSQQLSEGFYEIDQLTIGNDIISSIKVSAGWKVTLYEHYKGTGKSKVLTSDASSLPDFNDMVSSIRVEKVAAVLPAKFKLHAYSVSGNKSLGNYWMGHAKGSDWAIILTAAANDNQIILHIEKQDLGAGTVALKVKNYATDGDYYLTIDANDQYKVKIKKGITDFAKFKVTAPLQSAGANGNYVSFESIKYPNYYLRHAGYKMYIAEATPANKANKVYIEDASWLFDAE